MVRKISMSCASRSYSAFHLQYLNAVPGMRGAFDQTRSSAIQISVFSISYIACSTSFLKLKHTRHPKLQASTPVLHGAPTVTFGALRYAD